MLLTSTQSAARSPSVSVNGRKGRRGRTSGPVRSPQSTPQHDVDGALMTVPASAAVLFLLFVCLHLVQGYLIPFQSGDIGGVYARPLPSAVSTGQHLHVTRDEMRRRNTKTLASSSTGGDGGTTENPEIDAEILAKEALDSLQFSYKFAFIAGMVGIFTTFMEGDLTSAGALDLGLAARLSVVLHQFVVGLGLSKAWQYNQRFNSDVKSITPASLVESSRIHSRIWRATTFGVTLGAMALSATLPPSLAFQPWLVVLGLAVAGYVPIILSATRARKRAEVQGKPAATKEFESARIEGFKTARDMLLCMGSFALLGLVQIAATLLGSGGIVAKWQGVTDVGESFGVVVLLAMLNQTTLDAIVSVTDGSDIKASDYITQHEAEKGFYDKLGDIFKSQAIAKMLPYVFGMLKSFAPFLRAITT